MIAHNVLGALGHLVNNIRIVIGIIDMVPVRVTPLNEPIPTYTSFKE